MSASVLVISDFQLPAEVEVDSVGTASTWTLWENNPLQAEQLATIDYVVVIGQLNKPDRGIELGGSLRYAVDRGSVVVFLFPEVISGADASFLGQLAPEWPNPGLFNEAEAVAAKNDVFRDYLTVFGRSRSVFTDLPLDVEILGFAHGHPCAVRGPVGRGAICVLPYFVADVGVSISPLLRSVLPPILALENDGHQDLPSYLEDYRLPGEQDVLNQIGLLEGQIEVERAKADRLRAFRQLIGSSTGDSLEHLIVEALNVVLEDTDARAEDREDVGIEDFWIVGPEGDLALAEAKGIGGHIRRPNVNQVDDHRDAHELSAIAMPGLLIVNIFRNTDGDDAAQRSLEVHPDVVAHGARNNVLILRTVDLFNLLARKMTGKDAGQEFLSALAAGGGWLEVTDTDLHLHQ